MTKIGSIDSLGKRPFRGVPYWAWTIPFAIAYTGMVGYARDPAPLALLGLPQKAFQSVFQMLFLVHCAEAWKIDQKVREAEHLFVDAGFAQLTGKWEFMWIAQTFLVGFPTFWVCNEMLEEVEKAVADKAKPERKKSK
eukprot:Selendium_serpulae@DN3088_c0_g1_i1.p1